ncbi:dynein assembly factor 1, axonemal homolog [Contarinia nasturtii]|uniref:dynein assembly factor 1, axonemal homolog n=1 Tax=Contarinia nasturtii TaxID=265458 RepID=UPI0012D3BA9F|nr:dynein assembly factor 1, axonemal homolog [Contarinia nasturtii]
MAQNTDELKIRMSMTRENLINLCKKNKLYLTPYLNDVLYLHYQGYRKIENLDEFIGVKCLWLECNAISEISGLENQRELRCLYLHNNFIRKIENLDNCMHLDTLNLSHNYIKSIENCNSTILPNLNTLNLSHNSLCAIDGLEELIQCKNLSVLDISHNRIEDVLIVKILSQIPELRVLTLTGNPVINEIPSYRKTLTVECKNLTYLDSRPVFEKDRACAEAWKRGGYEEEKQEKLKWKAAQQKKVFDSVRATLKFRQNLHTRKSSSQSIDADDNSCTNVPCAESNINEIIENVENAIKTTIFGEQINNTESESICADADSEVDFNERTIPCDSNETISLQTLENEDNSKLLTMVEPSVMTSNIDVAEYKKYNTNILNICIESENGNGSTADRTEDRNGTPNSSKPIMIEVLSDSDSSDSSKVDDPSNSNDSRKATDSIEIIDSMEQTPVGFSDNNYTADPIHDSNETKSNKNSITFYCGNLDALKGTDSGSDCSIEEI